MLKVYVTLFIIGIIGSIGFAGYKTWNNMQAKIEVLKENNAKLGIAVETQTATISTMESNIKQVNEELDIVNKELRRTRTRNKVLLKKIQAHDLGMLGEAKPELVERVVNNASEKALRCFEIISGADLSMKERNAKNENAFNSECPWLWPGLPETTRQ
tara:strand:+ start:371 stop:844 length:474 start_codon:yes stop_codon:yes gene_type:complete